MKRAIVVSLILACHAARAQERESLPAQEQQLENQAEITETETEDDAYWQQLDALRRHPLDLNAADAADLEALPMLNALQVTNFLRYRSLFGRLVSLHELQAIPGWDIHTIRQLLPFVVLGEEASRAVPVGHRFRKGEHSLLLRLSQVLEKSKGFQPPPAADKDHYQGSPLRTFSRYRYNYNNLLQYGITADKDAGESFLDGSQKAGFDF
jgi:hypothetical protein